MALASLESGNTEERACGIHWHGWAEKLAVDSHPDHTDIHLNG